MGEMRVDLSELEETVRKLGRVSTAMSESVAKGKYQTELSPKALGKDFAERTDIDDAHREMQIHIREVMDELHRLIEDFGSKTKQAHGKYQNAEYDAKHGMDGGRSESGN